MKRLRWKLAYRLIGGESAKHAERADMAEQRYREIESKLQSGYSFCHPEEDCEGKRAWLRAEAKLEEAAQELERRAVERSRVPFAASGVDVKRLEAVHHAYRDAAQLLRDKATVQGVCERCKDTGHDWEPGPTGEPISTGPCPECGVPVEGGSGLLDQLIADVERMADPRIDPAAYNAYAALLGHLRGIRELQRGGGRS